MAHKKGEGKVKNGRDSHSKRLGIKIFGGDNAISGNIILRQRGTNYHPGRGVDMGKDHTIFAVTEGVVKFTKGKNDRRFVHVVAPETVEA
jgi:large subunit ribosomal protein L27